ncbi:MAG: glycosyl hydrolase [Bryobacteraceae bacterium]
MYNEPNANNNLTPQQYVQMYNTLVPAMQAADPSLKFAAIELGMNGDFTGAPQTWVPPFVSGVTARVDALTTHFYSTCDPSRTDAQLFATIPGFVADLQYIYAQMATNPTLTSVPVWLTENNVDCEASGTSNDPRGSSPFFASWRPYVFSQFGKAGNKALYQFTFNGNSEFGEVDQNVATTVYLSYWVDYWLVRMFPSPPGADMLAYTATDTADIEVLPVANPDGSVTVMIANLAVAGPADSNGAGAPRTVLVDTSALGSFSSASLLIIDRNTNLNTGPVASAVTPGPQITVALNGYGVAFLSLK